VLLVTGGSRGIGAATAALAADRGYAVGVNYRSNQRAAETVVTSIESRGGKAVAVQADVAVEDCPTNTWTTRRRKGRSIR
jgi:NAD(P)-dependent dehydrogenase (short-subunit alcohol dehydrogenase family)